MIDNTARYFYTIFICKPVKFMFRTTYKIVFGKIFIKEAVFDFVCFC